MKPLTVFIPYFLGNAPASDRKDLLTELELMKKLKPHPHVIKLIGCVTESGKTDVFITCLSAVVVVVVVLVLVCCSSHLTDE